MMRSLYSGVAGLKTHQIKMDVIGNNIANVNTVGYKSQSINFAELMYQTSQSASGPNATTGTAGTNAKQIGLGVKSAAISTAIAQAGSSQTTGNPFDLQLKGDAFFVVSDGSNRFFTRDGSFNVDAAGNLAMSSNGYNVMGWQVDETTGQIKKDTVSPLKVLNPENMTYPPEATTKALVSGIIDANDPDVTSETGKIMNLGFFDNAGYAYTAKISMKATGRNGEYSVEIADILDSNGKSVLSQFPNMAFGSSVKVPGAQTLNVAQGYTVNATSVTYEGVTYTFADLFTDDAQGTAAEKQKILANAYGFSTYEEFSKLYGSVSGADTDTLATMLAAGSIDTNIMDATGALTVAGKVIQGGIVKYNDSTKLIESVNGLTNNFTLDLNFGAEVSIPNGPFNTINIDFSPSNNYNSNGTSTIGADAGDKDGRGAGRKVGKMSGVSIEGNGMIYAHYDNGQTKLLGQIAVAEFPNAAGLEKQGDNLYAATLNSGEFDGIGVDVTASGGYISTGVLEMSNVDLSSEFTEMITTQRGFQANSRIITVSDTLLEELVNLKR
ncbi:MAG: flagellar hook-basal body complex protein [Roseburia sp.]|nr:flagellar hook-basal body complex protein [Roseburia sp.]MCM1278041.1 flagellar hook-basal body complex protein [Robinsoniella sp.]